MSAVPMVSAEPTLGPIERLVEEFSRLPGIGRRTATRLAYHVMRADPSLAKGLSSALMAVKQEVRLCRRCCNLTESELCHHCTDPRRATGIVCVVEQPQDVSAVAAAGFLGRFHVLHGALAPLDGVGPDQLHLKELLRRIGDEQLSEVILATNPTVEGDATALYVAQLLKPLKVRVSRIARGISVGGELEYADSGTIALALKNRGDI